LNTFLCTLVVSTSMVLPVAQAFAQTTGTTTTDPAVAAAQNQQALLDAQLKIQQDQQALLTGSLPTSSATPSTGAFSVSGTNPFPSEKLAYEQLKGTAKTLSTAMSNTAGPIVIYDSTEINNLVNYNALSATLDLLDTQANGQAAAYGELHLKAVDLEKLKPKPESQKDFAPILAPGMILSGLKTASDIVGMFRTNTTVAYNSFTADDLALTAAVANELLLGKKTVYLPAQMPLNLNGGASKITNTLGAIQKKLFDLQNQISKDQANVQQISDALGLYIAADQAGQANTDLITAETDKTKKQAELVKQKSLDRMTSAAKAYVLMLYGASAADPMDPSNANVNKAVLDQFLKRVALVYTSVSGASTAFSSVQSNLDAVSTGGTSSLSAILRAEALLTQVRTAGATVLSVKTSVLGGGVVTRLNLFTGGHLLYTGGAIVNYVVFDASGKIVMSGVLVCDDASKYVKY
jgi:hypothetical protein